MSDDPPTDELIQALIVFDLRVKDKLMEIFLYEGYYLKGPVSENQNRFHE